MHSWIPGVLGPQDSQWLDDVEHFYTARDELIEMAPWCRLWFDQPPGSAYWETISIAARRERVTVPALNIGGWYDIFLDGTIRNFQADSHPRSRLIIGPWGHDDFPPHLVGARNLGFAGSGGAYGLLGKALDFYQAAIESREPSLPRVSAYMLGARARRPDARHLIDCTNVGINSRVRRRRSAAAMGRGTSPGLAMVHENMPAEVAIQPLVNSV